MPEENVNGNEIIANNAPVQAPNPIAIAENLIEDKQFGQVIKEFADSKPWSGTFTQRVEKFVTLNNNLNIILNKQYKLAVDMPLDTSLWKYIISGCKLVKFNKKPKGIEEGRKKETEEEIVNPEDIVDILVLSGKLSVITIFVGWANIIGVQKKPAIMWANAVFKKFFPEQAKKTKTIDTPDGGMVTLKK
jgi:hypothetical protein